jgi:hypothetical protein
VSIPNDLRKRQRRFLAIVGCVVIGAPSMLSLPGLVSWLYRGAPALSWDDILGFLFFPGLGTFFFSLALAQFWIWNRYYLKVAQSKPTSDEEFIESCLPSPDEQFNARLALSVRSAVEEALGFPPKVLRGETNLQKLGGWWLCVCDKVVKEKFGVSGREIEYRGTIKDFTLLSDYIRAIDKLRLLHDTGVDSLVSDRAETPAQRVASEEQDRFGAKGIARLVLPRLKDQLISIGSSWLVFGGFTAIAVGGLWVCLKLFGNKDPNVFLLFGSLTCIPFALIVLLCLICLRTILIDGDAQTVTICYKFLNFIPVYRKRASFDQFRAVQFHAWVSYEPGANSSPSRQENRQVVLAQKQGKDWFVGYAKKYFNIPPCSQEDARLISEIMELPYEEMNTPSKL